MNAGRAELRGQLRRITDTLPALAYETWNFGDSVAFEAMVSASRSLDDPRWLWFAHGWIRAWATRAEPYRRLDATAPGRAMVQVYQATGDVRVLEAALRLADHLRGRPTLDGVYATWEHSPLMQPYGPGRLDARGTALLASPPPGVFVDCLHFDPPFLTALGAASGRPDLIQDGVDQALGYVRLLQEDSGLFMHFVLQGEAARFGPGWGRGQGWALLGLLDTIEVAAEHELPELPELTRSATALIDVMRGLQRPDGHWPAVVDDAESGEEFSTAAFMAAGFRQALRLGIVANEGRSAVAEAADRALDAVVRGISDEGILGEVSAAVMACTEPSHYAHVPRGFVVPWGQGPAALALIEALHDPQEEP